MLRKRVSVLVAAAMIVLAMFAASAPAFAQGEGGADVIRIDEECGTGTELLGACQLVFTPSGNVIVWAHAHPRTAGPAAGGGASHELLITECAAPHPAKGVITPSGNVNTHCTGQP